MGSCSCLVKGKSYLSANERECTQIKSKTFSFIHVKNFLSFIFSILDIPVMAQLLVVLQQESEPEISPQNMLKNQKDKACFPQMNAKKHECFVCAPAAHCTRYKAFAFICVC